MPKLSIVVLLSANGAGDEICQFVTHGAISGEADVRREVSGHRGARLRLEIQPVELHDKRSFSRLGALDLA